MLPLDTPLLARQSPKRSAAGLRHPVCCFSNPQYRARGASQGPRLC